MKKLMSDLEDKMTIGALFAVMFLAYVLLIAMLAALISVVIVAFDRIYYFVDAIFPTFI